MSGIVVSGDYDGAINIVAPVHAGAGVLTLPVATDTLVGKATIDTLTNKTLTAPILTNPALGTPASGNLANCSFPTFNQNTTGTAAGLSTTLPPSSGGTGTQNPTLNHVLIGGGINPITGVAPGTTGNVLTSNGITWASTIAGATGIGAGQTWQNVSGSRASNVTYTNTTGKPIFVHIQSSNGGFSGNANINGISFTYTQASGIGYAYQTVSVIIPPGNTYSFTTNASVWIELR